MRHRESRFLGAHDDANKRLRQRGFGFGVIAADAPLHHLHSWSLQPPLQLTTSRNNQETSLGACVLDGCPHGV